MRICVGKLLIKPNENAEKKRKKYGTKWRQQIAHTHTNKNQRMTFMLCHGISWVRNSFELFTIVRRSVLVHETDSIDFHSIKVISTQALTRRNVLMIILKASNGHRALVACPPLSFSHG